MVLQSPDSIDKFRLERRFNSQLPSSHTLLFNAVDYRDGSKVK